MSYLTKVEINDLIKKYQSELRKLEYQVSKTQLTIDELLEMIPMEQNDRYSSFSSRPALQESEKREPAFQEPTPVSKPPANSGHETRAEGPTIQVKLAPPSPKAVVSKKKERPGMRKRKKGGYRLSEWDQFLLDTLENEQRLMLTSEFLDIGLEMQKGSEDPMSESEIKGKLSRSIHKLANKRGSIVKVQTSGKGFAYALRSWFTASGELKSRYA